MNPANLLRPMAETSQRHVTPHARLQLKFSQPAQARRWLPEKARLLAVLQALWRRHGQPAAEVEVNFVDMATLAHLHAAYLEDASPTDIMTFDLGFMPDSRRLAALYLCVEMAAQHARRFRVALAQEVQRLVIHGVLHLLGYQDRTPAQRRTMRRRENELLRQCLRRR